MITFSNPLLNPVKFPGRTLKPKSLNPHLFSSHFPNPSLHLRHSQSFMALHICKPKPRSLCNSLLVHRFSTSQNDNNANNNSNNSSSSQQSSLNSYFSDVKASLKKPSQIQQQHQNATVSPFSRAAPSESASLEEIRNKLSEYRQRTVVPPPTGANPSSSFQEIYKRNKNSDSKPGATLSFEAIRESLRKKKLNSSNSRIDSNVAANSLSLSALKYSLKLKPQDGSTIIGGTQELPASVIGKEMKVERSGDSQAMRTEFVKMYSYGELGAKLKELRGEGWEGGFSLAELNERLMKLREMEEKESEIRIGGGWYGDLRECLVNLKMSSEEKTKKLTSEFASSC